MKDLFKDPSVDQIIAEYEKEIQLNATIDKYFIPVVVIGALLIIFVL